MACTLVAITSSNCPTGRAGISKAWVTEAANVSAFTFDSDGQITAVTMVTDTVFVRYDFEKDTGFFEQSMTRVKSNINVAQNVSMIFPVQNKDTRKALRGLFECPCGVIAIIKDNTGRYHVAGINTYPGGSPTWDSAQLRTGDSTANTGTDPTADSNEYVVTLQGNTNYFAPFSTIAEASIPV